MPGEGEREARLRRKSRRLLHGSKEIDPWAVFWQKLTDRGVPHGPGKGWLEDPGMLRYWQQECRVSVLSEGRV